MSDDTAGVRTHHFRNNWLTWAALHHFLSASLLRELVAVIVREMSNGTISLQDLFEDSITTGIDCMGVWLLRPLVPATLLGEYLQDRVRAFAWQNDGSVPIPSRGITSQGGTSPSLLEQAIRVGAADLTWPAHDEPVTDQLSFRTFFGGLRRLSGSFRSSAPTELLASFNDTLELIEPPLALAVVKHFGDLCADADEWEKAEVLYTEAVKRASLPHHAAWSSLVSSVRDMIVQSLATAESRLYGPARSAAHLAEALNSASMQGSPLIIANASVDELTASVAAADRIPMFRDRRATILSPPLLQDSHNGAGALRSWAGGDFNDAYRQFWAALRRQIALGSSAESGALRALYASSLFGELAKKVTTQYQPEAFRLATSLLLESGRDTAVAQIPWNETLVGTYVDQSCVDSVISRTDARKGSQLERNRVAVELFGHWAALIGLERISVAKTMLRRIAGVALTSSTSIYVPSNLGGRSLEVLRQIAQKRPELRGQACAEVSAAIVEKLRNAEVWTGWTAALETASAYVDAFSEEQLKAVIEGTLSLLDRINPEAGASPVVRPALNVLISEPTRSLSGRVMDLGRRIVATILRFGLQQGSEAARVLFYLHNFDSALLRDPSIVDKLREPVAELRRRSQMTNSSGVVENIRALLLAPIVSGEDGVKDAINGLDLLLASAEREVPNMGLPLAYSPLLALAEGQKAIAEDLSTNVATVRSWLNPILERVVSVWTVAKDKPLLFAMFSIPPATRPDPAVIHNWAFASIVFAASLGQEQRVQKVLAEALSQPALADSIALARATRSAAGDDGSIDTTAIRSENRETFYSALGRRLVLVQRIDVLRACEVCSALLDQCLRLGPRAIDAAVFVTALRLEIGGDTPESMRSEYVRRLQEQDRDLRLSLTPVVEMLMGRE